TLVGLPTSRRRQPPVSIGATLCCRRCQPPALTRVGLPIQPAASAAGPSIDAFRRLTRRRCSGQAIAGWDGCVGLPATDVAGWDVAGMVAWAFRRLTSPAGMWLGWLRGPSGD